MLPIFLQFISQKNLIKKNEKILLAVSGGLDSCVMAFLFSQSEFDFGIAHCNFQLRGKESRDDELFVKDLSSRLGKKYHTINFETEKFAEENKYSIQEAARILRYKWFGEVSSKNNYNKIATAHHLDDSIETFFINLIRGTGTGGLRGIPVQNNLIIRPLLFATRNEIEKFSQTNNIGYRTDSSNLKDDYLRNRIRHNLIPGIKNESPEFEENMRVLMNEISFAHHAAMNEIEEWKNINLLTDENYNLRIPIDEILSRENPPEFLSLLLYSAGITGVDCRKIISADQPGKIFHSKDFLILRDRNFIILQKKLDIEKIEVEIHSVPAEIISGKVTIRLKEETAVIEKLPAEETSLRVDSDVLSYPLILRPWKAGDYFISG